MTHKLLWEIGGFVTWGLLLGFVCLFMATSKEADRQHEEALNRYLDELAEPRPPQTLK